MNDDINKTNAEECLDELFKENDEQTKVETELNIKDKENPEEHETCECGNPDCKCNENGHKCECGEDCNCGIECEDNADVEEDIGNNDDNIECDADTSNSKHKFHKHGRHDCDKKELSKADEYFTHMLKLQAEFDNYRKRTENDVSKAYKNGFMDAVEDFLPALDSFKMAKDMITDKNTLIGIEYIEKGILATLEKMGVKTIDTSGKFDPNFHQAIDTDSTSEVESGYIVKECYKGFMMGDKVIRYAQVIVKK